SCFLCESDVFRLAFVGGNGTGFNYNFSEQSLFELIVLVEPFPDQLLVARPDDRSVGTIEINSDDVRKNRQMLYEGTEDVPDIAGLLARQIIATVLGDEDALEEIAAYFGIAHQHMRREIAR